MIKHDVVFQSTDEMYTLFATMGSDKQRWTHSYVECVYMALRKGGKVNKNVVVEQDVLWSVCWFYH